MLARVIFKRKDAGRIAIDAYDICKIEEQDDGVEVSYLLVGDEPEVFLVSLTFEEVVASMDRAQQRSIPKREGDEWMD